MVELQNFLNAPRSYHFFFFFLVLSVPLPLFFYVYSIYSVSQKNPSLKFFWHFFPNG